MDLDDYFPDDLDDDALFLLDQEEAKFAATQARRLTPPPSPPPAKRQKVSHIKQKVDIVDDEKPEIRLGVNGRYIVLGAHTSPINKQNHGTAAHTHNRGVDVSFFSACLSIDMAGQQSNQHKG